MRINRSVGARSEDTCWIGIAGIGARMIIHYTEVYILPIDIVPAGVIIVVV
jgi:hypothetical protein